MRSLDFDPTGKILSEAVRLLLIHYKGDTSDSVWNYVLEGRERRQGVIALLEDEKVIACVLYEMAIQKKGDSERKVILLRAMQGVSDNLRVAWKSYFAEFKLFAKSNGCDYVIIHGRPAWLRLGWDVHYVVVGTEI